MGSNNMKKVEPKKQASGGARLVAAGRTPVMLGVPADQIALLREAAAIDSRPVSQYVLLAAVAAAKKTIAAAKKSA